MPGLQGQVSSMGYTRGNHTLMFLSLSFSLLSPLSKNKINKILKKKKKEKTFIDADESMVITRRKGRWEKVEEGKGG